ncbi:MAG: class I SAM-dependent methyltransferase [Acidimicrobiia bacterium]|nr:class I SAM-dependent methyltransferase [Acidimicrobiia bacterium]
MTDTTPDVSSFRVQPEPWIAFQPTLDVMLEPLSRPVLARLAPAAGERVLDVGCGCGSTTLTLAAAVGPTGTVTGIDPSAAMIAVARQAAAAAGLENVEFIEGDAGTHPCQPHGYDVIFSRLGTMFFDEPEAAFTNLRRALRRGGRLGLVCWRSLEENAWTTEPRDAAAAIVPLPPAPGPDTPGPFSFARAEWISSVLCRADFVDVTIEPLDVDLNIGRGNVDEAIDFYLRLLPTGYLMFEPDHHLLDRLRATLRTVLERHRGDDGIRLGSASWLVFAR